MVIYSGFSTRRQQQRYNHLTKQLLNLLSQIIITHIESNKLASFRKHYEKILFDISKMDQHKYSQLKVSIQVQSLTQHIVNQQFFLERFSEGKKKDQKYVLRVKKNNSQGRNVESAKYRERDRRALSYSSDKKASRHTISEVQSAKEPTMQQLMWMHPLVEKKMGNIRRKRRYLHPQPNNFPQIQQQDEQNDQQE